VKREDVRAWERFTGLIDDEAAKTSGRDALARRGQTRENDRSEE
jgi:hypothetical protein